MFALLFKYLRILVNILSQSLNFCSSQCLGTLCFEIGVVRCLSPEKLPAPWGLGVGGRVRPTKECTGTGKSERLVPESSTTKIRTKALAAYGTHRLAEKAVAIPTELTTPYQLRLGFC